MFEPETETEAQNQQPTISRPQETQTDQLKVQSTSTTQTDDDTTSELTNTLFSASPGKQPLLDADVFNHLTTDEGNNVAYLNLYTNLTLKKKRHMYYFPMDFEKLTLDRLIDTGALTSAISEEDLNKIKLLSNEAIKNTGPAPNFQIMVANGQLERPIGTVLLQFEVADFQFQENFIVMKVPPNPLIGLCFLQRHNAMFDIGQGIITFPYLSMQLRPDHTTNTRTTTPLLTETSYTLQPGETLAISSKVPHLIDHNATGIVTPSSHMEDHKSIFITSSLCTVNNNAVGYQVISFSDMPYTLPLDTHMADFRVLTPEQIKHIKPVDPSTLTFMMHQHIKNTDPYLNQLMKTNQSSDEPETYWFPTPEEPGDPDTYTPIQQRIYDELLELKQLEQLNPNDNDESRMKFLSHFDWKDTALSPFEKQHIEDILVQYHDIFARHRFDIGTNREFKVKLTPNDDRPAYSQSLPTPINLKDDIAVQLALLHRYGIITTLPFSKYASPIFAQRKTNGRLRLLVDLRRINNLITQDYMNNNHPVSTLSDAAQHMAGKNIFCKLGCSQAYHCLQMADYQSIQMLAFNFASRTFAYRRLAQGLSR